MTLEHPRRPGGGATLEHRLRARIDTLQDRLGEVLARYDTLRDENDDLRALNKTLRDQRDRAVSESRHVRDQRARCALCGQEVRPIVCASCADLADELRMEEGL